MLYQKYEKIISYLKEKMPYTPEIGIIFGSGLGKMAEEFEEKVIIPYQEIPEFPQSTVKGHAGNLVFGKIGGKKVVGLQGRFHYYEGYPTNIATLPVRVLKGIGIKTLILTNASGGLNPSFRPADLMIISDHISFIPNPLIGPNDERFGPRFPALKKLYDEKMQDLVEEVAAENKIPIRKGIYLATTGPSYETDAELRFFRMIGADAVGMSTAPEAIVARHTGIEKIIGISCITNMAVPGMAVADTHEDVIATANKAYEKFSLLIRRLIERI